MDDVPPRLARILYRLVVASFALSTVALSLAGYCFLGHEHLDVASAAIVGGVGGASAALARLILRA